MIKHTTQPTWKEVGQSWKRVFRLLGATTAQLLIQTGNLITKTSVIVVTVVYLLKWMGVNI